MTAEQRRLRLAPFYIAQGIAMASLAAVITLLGDIRDEFGLSETQLGLVVGAGFFAAFVAQLTLGRLADKGYAPAMIRYGLVGTAICMIGFAFGSTFWEFMFWRALLGFAVGVAQPAIRRTVILAEPKHTGRNIGRLGVAEVLGFGLGPAVAGVLAEVGSFDLPFYVIAVVIIVTLLGIGHLDSDEGAQSIDDRSALLLLRDRRLVGTLIIVTSQFLLIGSYEAVWAVMATDLGAETWEIGLSFTVFGIPLALFATLGGSWAQRSGNIAIAAVGLGAAAVLAMPIAFINSVWGVVGMAFVAAIGAGIGFPAGLYFYSQTVVDERQAAAQGVLGATEVLFGGVAAVLAAWLYDAQDQIAVWLIMPMITIICILAGVILREGTRHSPHVGATT
ncbi:MAG: MFS transporter [Acidimicrobiales bacterium]|nr:MFS transporter [Acidimicrobiales bacterium]